MVEKCRFQYLANGQGTTNDAEGDSGVHYPPFGDGIQLESVERHGSEPVEEGLGKEGASSRVGETP